MVDNEEAKAEVNNFVNTLETFIIAIIHNENSNYIEDAVNLINAKEELVKVLSTIR